MANPGYDNPMDYPTVGDSKGGVPTSFLGEYPSDYTGALSRLDFSGIGIGTVSTTIWRPDDSLLIAAGL